jgi:putative membrane protein
VGFVTRVLVNAGAILLAAHLVSGLSVSSLTTALVAGLVLGVINAIVRPILVFLTLPLTLLTLGLFLLVLNAFCLWLTSVFVPGFTVYGFWAAFLGALIVSFVSWILTAFLSDSGRVSYYRRTA